MKRSTNQRPGVKAQWVRILAIRLPGLRGIPHHGDEQILYGEMGKRENGAVPAGWKEVELEVR